MRTWKRVAFISKLVGRLESALTAILSQKPNPLELSNGVHRICMDSAFRDVPDEMLVDIPSSSCLAM